MTSREVDAEYVRYVCAAEKGGRIGRSMLDALVHRTCKRYVENVLSPAWSWHYALWDGSKREEDGRVPCVGVHLRLGRCLDGKIVSCTREISTTELTCDVLGPERVLVAALRDTMLSVVTGLEDRAFPRS